MRNKETILNDAKKYERLLLEVLIDIRDLLQNPPVEISGEPSSGNHDDV